MNQEPQRLEEFFQQHPQQAARLKELAGGLQTRGENLGDRLLELYGAALAPALRTEEDLSTLIAVLEDTFLGDSHGSSRGLRLDAVVLQRFADANLRHEALLDELLPHAPALKGVLRQEKRLAVRLLCLGDTGVTTYGLGSHSQKIDGLIRSPDDARSLLDLCVAMNHNNWTIFDYVLDAFPAIHALLGAGEFQRTVAFFLQLIQQKKDLNAFAPSWLENLKQRRRLLAKLGIADVHIWTARLEPWGPLLPYALRLATSAADLERLEKAFRAIYSQDYGYTDRGADMTAMIPSVFNICSRLARTLDEYLALCAAVPGILRKLPETSESTPLGYSHSYDLHDLSLRAGHALDMNEFLSRDSTDQIVERATREGHPPKTKK